MVGVDPEIGISALRLWVAAASGALLAVCCVLAFVLPRDAMGAVVRVGFVVFGAAVGGAMVWAFSPGGDAGAERRALELRVQELITQSLAPGSPLACLNGVVADGIEAACEKEIFASPESVAATMSYTAARLALLSDLSTYAAGSGGELAGVLVSLRRSLEDDHFGFLAHVLAMHEGCTSEKCQALTLLRDSEKVRANLADAALDRYLDRYRPLWAKSPDGSLAEITRVEPSAAVRSAAPVPHSHMVDVDFPSAASIPPVSIMNPEPKGPVLPGVAAAAAANPNPPAAVSSLSRRMRRQPSNPPPAASAVAPGPTATVEPIWPEPVPQPPATSSSIGRGQ